MKRTTGCSEITFSIRSRASDMGVGPFRSGESRSRPINIARYRAPARRPPAGVLGKIRSAARGAHMALHRGRRGASDDEVVSLGLPCDSRADSGDQGFVRFGTAQRLAQVRRVLLPEAHIERAGAGD